MGFDRPVFTCVVLNLTVIQAFPLKFTTVIVIDRSFLSTFLFSAECGSPRILASRCSFRYAFASIGSYSTFLFSGKLKSGNVAVLVPSPTGRVLILLLA